MAFSSTRMLMAATGSASPPPSFHAASFAQSSTLTEAATIANTATGILSFWVNVSSFNTGDNTTLFTGRAGGVALLFRNTSHNLRISLNDSSGDNLTLDTSTTFSTGTWYNLLLSWNTNFAAGSKIVQCYINGTADPSPSISDVSPAFSVFYSTTGVRIGDGNSEGASYCASEVYFAPNQFLDFTVGGNVAKFISGGSPVNLGTNGATPTGTSPLFYYHGLFSDKTNYGSVGGLFTAGGTALVACGSAP